MREEDRVKSSSEADYWQGYGAAKENLRRILAQVAQVDEELKLAAVLAWLGTDISGIVFALQSDLVVTDSDASPGPAETGENL